MTIVGDTLLNVSYVPPTNETVNGYIVWYSNTSYSGTFDILTTSTILHLSRTFYNISVYAYRDILSVPATARYHFNGKFH